MHVMNAQNSAPCDSDPEIKWVSRPLRERQRGSTIDALPPELARNRILGSADAAAFWGVSLPHWRRMYRLGQVPKPIKLSLRKYGWRVGDLVDALAARSAA
jgi:predicted DNA-binding transcriptional regulator AlpA